MLFDACARFFPSLNASYSVHNQTEIDKTLLKLRRIFGFVASHPHDRLVLAIINPKYSPLHRTISQDFARSPIDARFSFCPRVNVQVPYPFLLRTSLPVKRVCESLLQIGNVVTLSLPLCR